MTTRVEQAVEIARSRFGDAVIRVTIHAGQTTIDVKREVAHGLLKALRDEAGFDFLQDIAGLDYLNLGEPERFAVAYHLYSYAAKEIVRVKAWVPEEDPTIDSVHDLWHSANWAEREAYDMVGIRFKGHPDLRRILMPDAYEGHPLRKDYPLTGRGERMNFPKYVAPAKPE